MDEALGKKLAILADAAKYDASCSSSGGKGRKAGADGIGSTTGTGICHSYTPDGRCISLLKILLTNYCLYDCAYCINRRSSNVKRARFTVEEVVRLTLAFYKRNYIEGLFLSSGIVRSSDDTMDQMVRVARSLREDHHFAGYIHLKTIPDADPSLIEQAGLFADRLSINVELPSEVSLKRLAPEKRVATIHSAMGQMRERIVEAKEEKRRFSPAGQSTQMIVGADDTNDETVLNTSSTLYTRYALRRVYYSAFSPIPDSSIMLPAKPPPLVRENRLYQADWLLRYYGFSVMEIAAGGANGMLDLEMDPKLAWALKHRGDFPVDVNTASREMLLRVPGLGVRAVDRILQARRYARLRLGDIARLSSGVKRVRAFLIAADHHPANILDAGNLRERLKPKPQQLALFV